MNKRRLIKTLGVLFLASIVLGTTITVSSSPTLPFEALHRKPDAYTVQVLGKDAVRTWAFTYPKDQPFKDFAAKYKQLLNPNKEGISFVGGTVPFMLFPNTRYTIGIIPGRIGDPNTKMFGSIDQSVDFYTIQVQQIGPATTSERLQQSVRTSLQRTSIRVRTML